MSTLGWNSACAFAAGSIATIRPSETATAWPSRTSSAGATGTHQRGTIRVSQCCIVAAVYASQRTAPAQRFRSFYGAEKLLFWGRLWYYFFPVKSPQIRINLTFGFRLTRGGAALRFWA